MSIRNIPINDLIQFLEENCDSHVLHSSWTIIDYIYSHYNLLSKRNIHTIDGLIYMNWCFCNHGTITAATKFIPGMLIRRQHLYGIIHEGKRLSTKAQTENFWIYYVDSRDGVINDMPFYAPEWNQWGMMDQIYDYSAYPSNKTLIMLGKRPLKIGDVGLDVLNLQMGLINFGAKVKLTGDFDNQTKLAVESCQSSLQLPITGFLEENDTLLSYLFQE